MQAVAARISFGKSVTVCNIYLPPSVPVTGAALYHVFEQLPRPFIVVGDINGHNPLWGSDHCDSRGRLFDEVFNDLNLCILNDGSSMYCHPASGTKSMLDLSMADPSLFLDLTWTVVDDLHGSDPFPVLVQFSQAEKPQMSDDEMLEMLAGIFTLISVLLLLLKKPPSLGKIGSSVHPFAHLNCLQNHS